MGGEAANVSRDDAGRGPENGILMTEHAKPANQFLEAAPDRDGAPLRRRVVALWWQFGPSWLASAAVHAMILVALGLAAVATEPGQRIEGLLVSFAEGHSPAALGDVPVVELEMPQQAPGDESVSGRPVGGPTSTTAGGQETGKVLAGGELTRLKIEAREGGDVAGGSPAVDIAAAIGSGQQLGNIVTPAPAGAGGQGQVVGKGYASFFGLSAKGYRFVYVVDGSGSMFGRRFAGARAELVSSLLALDEHQSFYVIFFNVTEYPQYYPSAEANLSPASPSTLEKVTRWMGSFVPNGDTNPVEAISRAMALQPDAIFFLTDGEFSEAVVETIQRQNYRRIPIHTIAFESQLGQRQLYGIAEMTGGTYRYVP